MRSQQILSALVGIHATEAQIVENNGFSSSALRGDRLCLLNWNIAKQNHNALWQQEFLAILRQYHPQLCFLQEARLSSGISSASGPSSTLGPKSTLGWYFTPNLAHHRQNYTAGVLTASAVSALHVSALHSQPYEPFLRTPKVALVTQYPIAQQTQTVLTVNVHGLNFVRSHKFQTQLHQIEQAIAHHQGPLILAGDFNTWRPKRMKLLQSVVQRLHLTPVQFAPSDQSKLKRFLYSDPLDHIFYRGLALQPEASQVLSEMESSDHAPMIAVFSVIV